MGFVYSQSLLTVRIRAGTRYEEEFHVEKYWIHPQKDESVDFDLLLYRHYAYDYHHKDHNDII